MIQLERATKFAKAKGVTKTILNDVSFTIPRGRSLALLGRNGAGKSTLLQIIAGTLHLDKGTVRRDAKVSWPLGFAGSFQGSLSGEQNVRFVARIYGVDTESLVEYVRDFAELGEFFRAPVQTYSSGMKARLAFGISMGVKFDYYLVDEVTAVGDTNFKRKSHQVFKERLKGSDVIMVSHSTSTLKDYCHSGVVLEDGKLIYFENLADAVRVHEENMARSYR
ncbi:capsular polysaccharide transport system ATP-binding protein [Rhizobium sp. PP-F2F-G48]|uniref:ABC transporter ATP-binding protein n=1 Tax=Rhizobium sp. PP-F2F-G48 TaxID=2135651 RepID=UPI001048B7F2|nr:ABC transporter ATP-binding protein [Rhizobium sp. PP-F2F-G48]TCM54474.1 capsular polysaccharide transport system ATP-binding protein [Rhizobium sp. PP-F2F-G48]